MSNLAVEARPPVLPNDEITNQLGKKLSRNLYIGLAGPIGSRLDIAREQLKAVLTDCGYQVVVIKLSKRFDDLLSECKEPLPKVLLPAACSDFYRTYRTKQETGNHLRRVAKEPSILAQVAIQEISTQRMAYAEENMTAEDKQKLRDLDAAERHDLMQEFGAREKLAFIIDQFKRPEEIRLLRQVYKDLFYLCVAVETEERRIINLQNHGISESEAKDLIKIDKKETDVDWGQQVQKAVLEADYFLNNNEVDAPEIKIRLQRLVNLIHGQNGLPPTQEEFGMFQAHTAGLGSLCLSRQVGAAILDNQGNVLSVGRNDVPKYGGGLYENIGGSAEKDHRCVYFGDEKECHNDKHKTELKEDIFNKITALGVEPKNVDAIIEIIENSRIKDLIEFSRSIHAEMDAIISLTRKGVKLTPQSTLYTTTFPCHMCARHIITAGIDRVIYIEPYEKSMAIALHKDSITTSSTVRSPPDIVTIRSFHGVAPRRYQAFFQKVAEKKKEGKAIFLSTADMYVKDVEHVVSFLLLESKCVQDLGKKIGHIDA